MKIQSIIYRNPVSLLSYLPQRNLAFLDSSRYDNTLGRYSYIGIDPHAVIRLNPQDVSSFSPIQSYLESNRLPSVPGIPPFQGGLIGYLSYDLAFQLENIPRKTKKQFTNSLYHFNCYDLVICFDHQLKRSWIVSTGLPEKKLENRNKRAEIRSNWLQKLLSSSHQQKSAYSRIQSIHPAYCLQTDAEYLRAVDKVKTYIRAGDIFQANIARCYQTTFCSNISLVELYQRLRHENPAPFASFLNFSDLQIMSSSPERFVKLSSDMNVETRPIKGTIQRNCDSSLDQKNAHTLLNSKKDRAENIMIVDLMRNDLSKICEIDSIKVEKLCQLESYETVHHLVSSITGVLQENITAAGLLKAVFPGGSITGAPKIRAMQIIEELEPVQRGPYCGIVGYIGTNGEMDSSITIRTMIASKKNLFFHTGSAIVLDSDPELELQETEVKAKAMKHALSSRESRWY